MKKAILLLSAVSFSSCGTIDQLNCLVNESTYAIQQNTCIIESNTETILQNAALVNESTQALIENQHKLEAAKKESQSDSEVEKVEEVDI